MRTYYIFNISKEFCVLTKDCPFNLFKSLESLYYMDKSDLDLGMNLFDQIVTPFKIKDVNLYLNENFKNNDFYISKNNYHRIYNKYRDEILEINVHNSYMKVKTNMNKKNIFQNIAFNKNLFVCDFINKDYFWLNKILTFN